VIDYDEYLTGERKEGAYLAGWSFVMKPAAGIMVGVVGYSLEWSAFDREALEQSDRVKDTMIFLMGAFRYFATGSEASPSRVSA